MAIALAAFWKGLSYDAEALDEALRSIPRLDRNGFPRTAASGRSRCAGRAHGKHGRLAASPKIWSRSRCSGPRQDAPDELPLSRLLAQAVLVDEVSPADMLLLESGASGVERTVRAHAVA